MKKILTIMAVALSATAVNAKTLIAYYSYTNSTERVVNELRKQIDADVIEIEPVDKNADYNANNYALGSEQIDAINANPDDASSYPAIDPVEVNMAEYDMVIIATPLWHAQMAAPFQTFLFKYGPEMAGKNIGVIVSSWSSGISGVIRDAKRLIPEGKFIEPYLWDSHSNPANASRISTWLSDIHYNDLTSAVSSITADNEFEIITGNGTIGVNGDFNTLALYNLSGTKVAETTDSHISADTFTPGTYIAQAINGNRSVTRKINIR